MSLKPNTTTEKRLYDDLAVSYKRHHDALHIHFTEDGAFIAFEDCSLWECKNHREKLAEWRATLDFWQ